MQQQLTSFMFCRKPINETIVFAIACYLFPSLGQMRCVIGDIYILQWVNRIKVRKEITHEYIL